MASLYRLIVSTPKTVTTRKKEWTFAAESNQVLRIEVNLRKDRARISTLEAQLFDPEGAIFHALPDCALTNVPIRLELASPEKTIPVVIFDGIATSFRHGFPGPTDFTLSATDNSVKARRHAPGKTYANTTSVEVAKKVAKDHGWEVDVAIGATSLIRRGIDMGISGKPLSSWDQMTRALAADGLVPFMKGSTLKIRRASSNIYKKPFRKDTGIVKRIDCSIEHVKGPGKGGAIEAPLPGDFSGGTVKATGISKAEADAQNATLKTGRPPVGGAASSTRGSHAEDGAKGTWTNRATRLKERKDSLVIACRILDDFELDHIGRFEGWGAKIDGDWATEQIRYQVTGGGEPTMMINFMRGPSQAALKSIDAVTPGEHSVAAA